MTINYLKNKKYYILASLFCYALGAQKVAAATKEENPKLTYTWNNGDSTYEIADFKEIKKLYEEASYNIAVFARQDQDEDQYIFIMDDPSFFRGDYDKKGSSQISVTKFYVKTSIENEDESEATLAAYSKGWFGEEAFIFSIEDCSFNFYYRKDGSGGELIEISEPDNNFYQSNSPNEEGIYQVWEVDPDKQKIVATWEISKDDIQYMKQPTSKKGWLYHTLALGSNDDNETPKVYRKATYLGMIGICMAVVVTIVCAAFHKAIHKKVMELVHRYIPSKKKMM